MSLFWPSSTLLLLLSCCFRTRLHIFQTRPSVHIVIDSDVAHIVGGEDLLNIKAGVKLVSAKTGEILRNDDGDVAVAHVIHHLLKGWAIEVCSGIAIVHIKSGILEPILIGVLL